MLVNFKPGGAWVSKSAKKKLQSMRPEKIHKILVIRHVAIGDMVMSRPFFVEAQNFFSNASITLSLINDFEYGAPTDLVDKTEILYKRKKRNGKTDYKDLLAQINTHTEYDLLFDQTDSALSMWITLLSKAKIKLGFPHRTSKRFIYDATVLRSDMVLETETLLHQLQLLGAPLSTSLDFKTQMFTTNKEAPYIIYFAGASADYKCWSKENFISLIDKMAQQYPDITHVILEGMNESEKFDDIFKPVAHHTNVKKQIKLSLEDVMPFLGQSLLVVSNDTGIRNMAISINTATVGIFFSTVPFRYWPKSSIHHVVFKYDRTPPSPKQVLKSIKKIITDTMVEKQ